MATDVATSFQGIYVVWEARLRLRNFFDTSAPRGQLNRSLSYLPDRISLKNYFYEVNIANEMLDDIIDVSHNYAIGSEVIHSEAKHRDDGNAKTGQITN